MEPASYRNIKSLHPIIQPITLDQKINELRNLPEFELIIDRIFSQIQIKGRIFNLIE